MGEEGGRGRGGGLPGCGVGSGGEEGEHGAVDVDLEAAGGDDVGADVELVGVGGEEEGWVDVGLGDEVAELRGHYVVVVALLVVFS